jgi:hypothetical protein
MELDGGGRFGKGRGRGGGASALMHSWREGKLCGRGEGTGRGGVAGAVYGEEEERREVGDTHDR